MQSTQSTGFLRSYPKVFWVANIMELFERAAYYGMNSVLAVYLSNSTREGGLGFSEDSVGFLQSLVYAFTYVVPIIGGALADHYGYRRMLLVAFSLLTTGYFVSGNMSAYSAVFASLLLMATGAGLFKPIISGTIARSTNEQNSGFGFGIYYWMINLGAFAAPLFVSYLRGFSWSYVFTASSIYCALMLIPTVFIFRDPPGPEGTKTLKEVLGGMAMVLGDARFMLMIFVYSCFWILYFQNFGTVLWYLRDFIDKTPVNTAFAHFGIRFSLDAEHVTVINAGTIILLQVLVSRLVRTIKPLPTMVAGIILGVLGFLCLAFAANVWIFLLGISIFSIGEMTAHPKYYSYIGLVSPSDRKAVYMGYAFLYGVIGSLVGSSLGGEMYNSILKPLIGHAGIHNQLRNFWLLFAGLGTLTAIGLIAYNHIFAADTPETNRRARFIMTAVYAGLILVGCWFFHRSVIASQSIVYRTMVQALIMLVIGISGLAVSLRRNSSSQAQG